MHLVIDLAVSPDTKERFWRCARVLEFVQATAERTGLTRVGDPLISNEPDVFGLIQLIAESHISVHLDREHCQGWVDVFSCRDFDKDAMLDEASAYLASGKTDKVFWRLVKGRGILPAMEAGDEPS